MTKFVTYNETTGTIIGFYKDEADVPSTAPNYIEITDEQWGACLGNPGYTIQDKTLAPPVSPTSEQLLKTARTIQNRVLNSSYSIAIQQPVLYATQVGIEKAYQADPASIAALQFKISVLQTTSANPTTPSGFYWIAFDNTKVPFTYKDLQGLLVAIDTVRTNAFQKLQTLKAAVNANTNLDIIKQTIWS